MLECIHQASPDHRRIMVLGHNPGITRLCAELTEENRPFGTACLAVLEHDEPSWTSWLPNHEARLIHFESPRTLR
jgi:phosphohistidine phosphatase SixA